MITSLTIILSSGFLSIFRFTSDWFLFKLPIVLSTSLDIASVSRECVGSLLSIAIIPGTKLTTLGFVKDVGLYYPIFVDI